MSRVLLLLGCALPLLAGAASDPTLPPAAFDAAQQAAETPPPPPPLQAILRGPHGARAVIGGQSLRVGERQGELRVLAIRAHSVLIERLGQRQELRLAQPILRPSTLIPSR